MDVRCVARFFRKKVTATRIVLSLGRDLATQDQDRAIGSANRDEEILAAPETIDVRLRIIPGVDSGSFSERVDRTQEGVDHDRSCDPDRRFPVRSRA